MEQLLPAVLSHFFRKGKPQTRWRDVKTGRFVKPFQWRLCFGATIPLHGDYRKVTHCCFFNEEPSVREEGDCFGLFMQKVIDKTDYTEKDWWFDYGRELRKVER